MSEAALDQSFDFNCPTCALAVPGGFVYCPRCRASAQGTEYDPESTRSHERQYVISLVVVTLGAIALPRLLRSTAFSAPEKAALGLLAVLNTGAVFGVCVLFARWFPVYLHSLTQQ